MVYDKFNYEKSFLVYSYTPVLICCQVLAIGEGNTQRHCDVRDFIGKRARISSIKVGKKNQKLVTWMNLILYHNSGLCESGIDGGWPMVFYVQGTSTALVGLAICFLAYENPAGETV